jgi:Na+/H+-dicarboxylate symporter
MTPAAGTSSIRTALMALLALIAGFASGLFVNLQPENWVEQISWAELAGKVWLTLLIAIAVPLTSAYLFNIVSTMSSGKLAGRIGLHALLFHILIMMLGMGFTLSVSYVITDYITTGFTLLVHGEGPIDTDLSSAHNLITWTDAMQTFLARIILPLLMLSAVTAWVLSRYFRSRHEYWRARVLAFSEKTSTAMYRLLLLLPVAAFTLSFSLTAKHGYTLAGVMGQYVAALIGMLIVFILVLYLIALSFGAVPPAVFASALLPAQLVAASTRSSLATMPALLTGAEQGAGIPPHVSRLVIPFSVSVFRINRAITSVFSYVFFTSLYNIPTDVVSTVLFLGLIMALSFGSPGLPSGGKLATMPVFLALGVPLEMIVLTKAIDIIPDMFKTVLNVTESMTIASLVARSNEPERPQPTHPATA